MDVWQNTLKESSMMYDIGFVSFNELDKEKYIEALRNTQLHVNLISKDEAAENANKYDGIIIEENHSQNIGMICELIILIKKKVIHLFG